MTAGRSAWLLSSLLVLAGCSGAPDELLLPNSGGALTVKDASRKAYARPAPNLDVQQRAEFFIGNAFFNSPWIAAPATAAARDGLGPLFNARSCDACHNNDGRGAPPTQPDERPVALVFQFGTLNPGQHGEPVGDPHYGANLNPFSIGEVPPEGTVRIAYKKHDGTFADGEPYTLLEPQYHFEELAYGEIAPDSTFSPRIAPSVFGIGLLEAVSEATLLEYEDADDRDGDGISGRANRVWNYSASSIVIGRFGWKANQPDIAHQSAAAFNTEMGLTTSLLPQTNCTNRQIDCLDAPDGGSPEISDEIFEHIISYQRMLAVPARRNLDAPGVKRGAQLFADAGCAACHRPTLRTGEVADRPWLSNQVFHPYTDLLLHDMGPELADGRPDFQAGPSEWRTPPLWGLGLLQTVNGHTRLLHDGRARDVTEAILWHGGEAERAREAFRNMPAKDRQALLEFLDSL